MVFARILIACSRPSDSGEKKREDKDKDKGKNKRVNAKIKRAGTGESACGSLPSFLFFFFPVRASRALSSFALSSLSRSLEQARILTTF